MRGADGEGGGGVSTVRGAGGGWVGGEELLYCREGSNQQV